MKKPGYTHTLLASNIRLLVAAFTLLCSLTTHAQLNGSFQSGSFKMKTEHETHWNYPKKSGYIPPMTDLRKMQRSYSIERTEFIPDALNWSLTISIDSSNYVKSFPEEVRLAHFNFSPSGSQAFDENHQLIHEAEVPQSLKTMYLELVDQALSEGYNAPPFDARLDDAVLRNLQAEGFQVSYDGQATMFSKPGTRLVFDPGSSSIHTFIYAPDDESYEHVIAQFSNYYTWHQNRYWPSFQVRRLADTLSDGTCAVQTTTTKVLSLTLPATAHGRSRMQPVTPHSALNCYLGTNSTTVFLDDATRAELDATDGIVNIHLLDITGKVLYSVKQSVPAGQNHVQLSHSTLPPAAYVVVLRYGNHIKTTLLTNQL